MGRSGKLRQIYILQILYHRTDETHCLTTAEILQILREEYGMNSYRKTVKEDIDLLIAAGYDIQVSRSHQNLFHFVSRDFDTAELKILIDAVESSRFISKEKSEALAEKISRLGGPYTASELKRNIDVENRAKADNRMLLYIIDAVNDAINQNKKIRFRYFEYNLYKEKTAKHNGIFYTFSPYKLVWNGDYYYIVGYSEKHEGIGSFRIDRILGIPVILEDNCTPPPEDFNMNKYLNTMFRMYTGQRETVELICNNSLVDTMIDQFGEEAEIIPQGEQTFRLTVQTVVSHVFYSWVFGFRGKVRISKPENIKNGYIEMIRNALDAAGNEQTAAVQKGEPD